MDKIIIWCGLNAEQDALEKIFNEKCVSIRGGMSPELKVQLEKQWSEGDKKILITKAEIFGHGLNWQICNKMIFFGLSDSFEQFYQAVRRCWRTGQKREVFVYVITSKEEGQVVENIKRKEKDFERMQSEMVKYTKKFVIDNLHTEKKIDYTYNPTKQMILPNFIGGLNGN